MLRLFAILLIVLGTVCSALTNETVLEKENDTTFANESVFGKENDTTFTFESVFGKKFDFEPIKDPRRFFKTACSGDHVLCDNDHYCYSPDKRCDSYIDCPDASDEIRCSCAQRIENEFPSRICDTIPDCPDWSDELGCQPCNPGEMKCYLGTDLNSCVSEHKICDGTYDCSDGEDETLCIRFSENQFDNSSYLPIRRQGYLQVKRNGAWWPSCIHDEHDYSEMVRNYCEEIVGGRDEEDTYNVVSLEGTSSHWAYLSALYQRVDLVDSCSTNLGLNVSCAEPRCVRTYAGSRTKRDIDILDIILSKNNGSESSAFPEAFVDEGNSGSSGRHRRDHTAGGRVVGGEDSSFNAWPFIVGIVKEKQGYLCGGSIISNRWILSAGHCFVKFTNKLHEIQAGMLRQSSYSPYTQTATVSHVIRHEDYNFVHLNNDISLLRLSTPLQLNRWVRPVCLASNFTMEGKQCTVAGWGATSEGGPLADALQEVVLPTMATCENSFTHVDDNQVVCAGYPEGQRDSCQGDSGGPMMCREGEVWVQAGAVSFGAGCARPNSPGVYSRMTFYREWIFSTIDRLSNPDNLPSSDRPRLNCKGTVCRHSLGMCIDADDVCDGRVDCLDFSDEESCGDSLSFDDEESPISSSTSTTSTTTSTPTTSTPSTTTTTSTTTTSSTSTATSTSQSSTTASSTSEEIIFPEASTTTTSSTTASTTTSSSSLVFPNLAKEGFGGYDNSYSILQSLPEESNITCFFDDFRCSIVAQCLPWEAVCDGTRDCHDGTDEIGCTCLDHLLTFREDFECDGFYDCFDLSDELCSQCGSNFLCPQSRMCIEQSKVCNVNRDCIFGEDELNCLGLLPEPGQLRIDKFGNPRQSSKGYLALRQGSDWNVVCDVEVESDIGFSICSYLGYSKLSNVIYKTLPKTIEKVYGEPSSSPKNTTKRPDARRSSSFQGSSIEEFIPGSVKDFWVIQKNQTSSVGLEDSHAISKRSYSSVYEREGVDNPLQFIKELRKGTSKRRRAKRNTCKQAYIECEEESCGKAPLYFYERETPVWMPGGTPWAGSVYVTGQYRCGCTLIQPDWVVTSVYCMNGVDLSNAIVAVVMGSWRRIASPTRLWGAHEHERRVIYMESVMGTDILVMRLEKPMPKTPYINHLCLLMRDNFRIDDNTTCVISGPSDKHSRLNLGIHFNASSSCPLHKLCPKYLHDSESPCMRPWAGLIACQQPTDIYNPTWYAVGIWAYSPPDESCSLPDQHPLLSMVLIRSIMEIFENFTPRSVAECKGELCATGVCVKASDHCDGTVSCPDLADEPATCPPIIKTCEKEESGTCICPNNTLQCGDGVCVQLSQICDGVVYCPNGADERELCSCAIKLLKEEPSRVCDGIIDCKDERDEAVCGCKEPEYGFRCYLSDPQKCIQKSQICDGAQDCDNREDEAHCMSLAPAIVVRENVLGVPYRYPEGYLTIRLKGRWYTFLYQSWEKYLSNLVCLQLDYLKAIATDERMVDTAMVGKRASSRIYSTNSSAFEMSPMRDYSRASQRDFHPIVYIRCATS